MSQSTHPGGYVKGCQCERCAAARARSRARSRAHPDKGNPQRRKYKTEKQRQYNTQRLAETGQSYYEANREQVLAKAKDRYALWRQQNPLPPRTTTAKPRHGGPDEWARTWEAQDGCCYLCGETFEGTPKKFVVVDHDHECHPVINGHTQSCRDCRRGLAHAWCNQIIGLCGEDMDRLRAIIANFGRVNPETKARVAAAREQRMVLDVDAGGATAEAKTAEPMPDLDMPVGATWPQASEGLLF